MNGLHELLSTGLAYRLGWTLLHSLWEGAAIAGLFGLALLIIPARRANARYAAGCVSLITLMGVCIGTFAIIKAPEKVASSAVVLVEPVTAEVGESFEDGTIEIAGTKTLAGKPPVAQPREITPSEPWYRHVVATLGTTLTPALPWLAGAWLAGVLILSLWRCGGLIATYRLRRMATAAVPDETREMVARLAERLRVSRPVRVLQSAVLATPAVIGHLRPVILLPIAAVTGLSARELEAILAHELAHIRRYDYLVNILQTVVETLLFHHPAVWWMSQRIRAERENCCDDIALSVCGDRLTYARALAQVEQLGAGDYGLAAAASGGSLLARIRRIVDVSGSTGTSWSTWLPGFLTIVLVLAVLLGARMRTVGANGPATQPASDEAASEVPPGLVAMVVKDASGKPLSISKIIEWRIALPDSEYSESRLEIEDRQANGSVLIKPPHLSSDVEPGARMSIRIVTDLGQPIRAIGRFPVDDQPRMVFTTTQKLWTAAREKQSMSGKVTDENGRPVSGVRVELLNPDMLSEPMQVPVAPGQAIFTPSDTAIAQTDEGGTFAFENLNQGKTDVVVKHADHRPTTLRDIPTGDKPIEIKLFKPRRFPIAGRVQDSQGKPISGAQILLATRSLTGSPLSVPQITTVRTKVTTNDNGEFRFPGEFDPIDAKSARTRTLFVSKPGCGVQSHFIDSAGEDAVNITLSPATTISGKVTDESGNPIAHAEVWAWSIRPSSVSFGLTHYLNMEDRAPRAKVDDQGKFTIERLPADSLAMLSTSAPGFAVRRTQNVDTGSMDVDITLEHEAVLKGRVIREDNKQPVADVRLGTQGLHSANWSETKTDAQGQFELEGLKGEALNVLPLLPEPAPGQAPEWAAAAIEVKDLEPGQTRDDLEIVLTKGGIIRGQVTDKDGRPLEGVDIAFYSGARPRSGAACESTHTDREGRWAYRFPPGAVYVYIRDSFPGGTWSKASYDVDVESGETIEGIDFKLSTVVPPPASQPAANTETVKPAQLQVAIEAKIAFVPTNVDRELQKSFPTSRQLSPQLRAGDALSTAQAAQLLQELAEKKTEPKDFPRVVVPDGRTAYNGLVTSSTPVTIDGVEYDPPHRRLQVGVNVAKDRKHVAATVNANLKAFLAENGTHIEETVNARGELTLEDRRFILLRAPVRRHRVKPREPLDFAKPRPSASTSEKYAYIILRATIIWPSEPESASESAVEGPRSSDQAKSGIVYVEGEVERPGGFATSADAPLTLLRVIAAADGLKESASSKLVCRISRYQPGSKSMTRTFDLEAILENRAEDPKLEHNDYVFVSTKGRATPEWKESPLDGRAELPNSTSSQPASIQLPRPTTGIVDIAGEVRWPGPYRFSPELTLRRALAAAGGIEPAKRKGLTTCRIGRLQENGSQNVIEIDDLERLLSGERADIEIHPGDVIRVESKEAKKSASAPAETRGAKSAPPGIPLATASTQPPSRAETQATTEDKLAWGETVEGVRCRLVPVHLKGNELFAPDEPVRFKQGNVTFYIELESEWGERTFPGGPATGPEYKLAVDGKWYSFGGMDIRSEGSTVGSTARIWLAVELQTWRNEMDGSKLRMAPGTHSLQVAVTVPAESREGKPVSVLSNVVECGVLSSEAVEGENARATQPANDEAKSESGPPILIECDLVELGNEFAEMEVDSVKEMLRPSMSLQDALDALKKVGRAEVLSRPKLNVKESQPATITIGEKVPVLRSVEPKREIGYEEVGTKLAVEAQWRTEDNPRRLRIKIRALQTGVSSGEVSGPEDVQLPVFKSFSTETVVVSEEGVSTWIVGKPLEVYGKHSRLLIRLKATAAGAEAQRHDAALQEGLARLEREKTAAALNELLQLNNERISGIEKLGHPTDAAGIRNVQRIRSAGREYVAVVARRYPIGPARRKAEAFGWGIAIFFSTEGVYEGRLGGEAGEDGYNGDDVRLITLGTPDLWFGWVQRFEKHDPFTYLSDVHLIEPGLPSAFRVRNFANSTGWTGKPDTRLEVPYTHYFWFNDEKEVIKWGDKGIGRDGKLHDMLVGWDPQGHTFRGPLRLTFNGKPVYEVDLAHSTRFEPTDVTASAPARADPITVGSQGE